MIRPRPRWLPEHQLVVVAGSTSAALDLLACGSRMIEPVAMVTRLRLDAALSEPAPVRNLGTTGRPRKKGARQPTLTQRLADPNPVWQSLSVAGYGGTTRTVELASETAVWYHTGLPPVAIRWGLIRDRPSDSLILRRCCVPINRLVPKLSWSGGWCAGRWKEPYLRFALIWAWRPSDSGRAFPSCAPLPPCSLSFLWSRSLLISCSRGSLCLFVRRRGRAKRFRLARIRWTRVGQHL